MILSSIPLPASVWQAVSGKCFDGQLRLRARFLSDLWATMIHPTLSCRPPWGSQMCDTVVELEWSGVEWSGVEWSGAERSGVEWSGVAWRSVGE